MKHWCAKQGARAEKGFTLLELLVVMVIIGLLVGYVAPKYFSQVGKSEVKAAQAQIDAIEKALDQYRLDVGSYPVTEQGLAALTMRPTFSMHNCAELPCWRARDRCRVRAPCCAPCRRLLKKKSA